MIVLKRQIIFALDFYLFCISTLILKLDMTSITVICTCLLVEITPKWDTTITRFVFGVGSACTTGPPDVFCINGYALELPRHKLQGVKAYAGLITKSDK